MALTLWSGSAQCDRALPRASAAAAGSDYRALQFDLEQTQSGEAKTKVRGEYSCQGPPKYPLTLMVTLPEE